MGGSSNTEPGKNRGAYSRDLGGFEFPFGVVAVAILGYNGWVWIVFEDGEESGFCHGKFGEGFLRQGAGLHRSGSSGHGRRRNLISARDEVGVDGVGLEEIFC